MVGEKPDSDVIRSSVLGDELNKAEANGLAAIMGVRRLRDGEVLVKEGESEKTLFLLAEGQLSVASNDTVVYTMRTGECAGTRAFVDRAPRKATLRAVGNAVVYTLDPEQFESLLEQEPRTVYKVMRALFRITHSNLMRMNLESQELANYISKSHGRY